MRGPLQRARLGNMLLKKVVEIAVAHIFHNHEERVLAATHTRTKDAHDAGVA